MPPAARITDLVIHPLPPVLTPGPSPGCPTVLIGGLAAWRGVGGAGASVVNSAKKVADTAIEIAEKATLAAAGTPGLPAAKAAEEKVKLDAAASMSATIMSAAAGTDIHICAFFIPPPPHGPGVVTTPSKTVMIGNFPAARMGDTIIEAAGPPNTIAMGFPTVMIGG